MMSSLQIADLVGYLQINLDEAIQAQLAMNRQRSSQCWAP